VPHVLDYQPYPTRRAKKEDFGCSFMDIIEIKGQRMKYKDQRTSTLNHSVPKYAYIYLPFVYIILEYIL
jgi:hypothetical protein